jgi:hypothetical protein
MNRLDVHSETDQEAGMTESSLYERLGDAIAIAAVADHFSDAVVHNPIVGQKSENPPSGNGTPTIWADFQASRRVRRSRD